MLSASPAETVSPSRAEVFAFRLLLIVIAIVCLMEFWYANSHTEAYRISSPLLTPRLWNLYLTFKIASVVALIGIWNWRQWGLTLLTAMGVAMLFMEFYTASSYSLGLLGYALRVPVVLGVVWFLAQRFPGRFQ